MTSKEYWLERLQGLHNALMDKGDKYNIKAARAYQKAVYSIQQEINEFYQRFADKNGITYANAKKLLTSDERKALQMTLDEYIEKGREMGVDGRWVKELENASTVYRIDRLKAIQIQMQNEVEQLTAKISDGAQKTFSDVYKDSYYKSLYEAQKAIGEGKDFAKLDKNRIDKVLSEPWAADGSNFSERLWNENRPELVHQLNTRFTQGIIRGEAPEAIIKAITKSMNASYNAVSRVVITESAYFAGRGRLDTYKQLGVERYQFLASLDERTCDTCGPLDGMDFAVTDEQAGINYPPIHPRCRCTTIPFFNDEFTEGETRSAKGAKGKTYQVPSDMTYAQWKEKYVDNSYENIVKRAAKKYNIRGIIDVNPKPINVSKYSFDENHIYTERGHNVTREEAERFMMEAKVCITRWNGQFLCYYGSEGTVYIDKNKKLIKTAFRRKEYVSDTLNFIKEVEKYEN